MPWSDYSDATQTSRKLQNHTSHHHPETSFAPLRTEPKANGPVRFASIVDGFPFREETAMDQANRLGDIVVQRGVQDGLETLAANENGHTTQALGGSDNVFQLREPAFETPKKTNLGTSTPPTRRSVQFVRPPQNSEQLDSLHPKSGSWDVGDGGTPGKDRQKNLFSRLRALASSSSPPSHVRNPSSFTVGADSADERQPNGTLTPESNPQEPRFAGTLEENQSDVDADADVEQSGGEDNIQQSNGRSRRRKSRRPQDGGTQTAPTTPKTPFMRDGRPSIFHSSSHVSADTPSRPYFLPRRATMTDVPTEDRQGVSEDEGRDRLAPNSPWRRGSAWMQSPRGLSYNVARRPTMPVESSTPRPSNFRRLTGFGGSGDNPDGTPFSPWKIRGERTSSLSAAKWRQLKAGIRMIGQRRKQDATVDHVKSAELMAELTAGVPAALILASMFQRDEHGHRRIPVLLEQLKVQLTDSRQVDSKSGDRHMVFRIEMEYGNGLTRMKWVIHRALRDFANLHARYKILAGAQKYIQLRGDDTRTKLPHFPRSAFPYLRGVRGVDDSESEGEDDPDADATGPSGGEASGPERPGKRRKRLSSTNILRRKSSLAPEPPGTDTVGAVAGATGGTLTRKDFFAERQRRKLEVYLQQMIRYLIFRPESNRICKFLELSALGVRLAAEGSYHGKEGYLIIQSGKGVDFRKAWKPSLIKGRHGPKWFLVRHSYVVCVDSPEEMNIYDVFLVDSSFRIQTKQKRPAMRDQKAKDIAKSAKESAKHPQHHRLKIYNSERKLRLLAKNERQLHQFEDSIRFMSTNTPWANRNRFDSFAPIRPNVFAQWLVDGRDYMWNVSRAISMAKDVIYIHDWWLSPELYMRRPAAISQKWRLDRLLQRKAREGVKVFVIMYRNINSAIPIDSEYTKFSLLDLHPNVFVQRSPNQIRQGTFFWAHHEKVCIVDHMVAFVGGIDLCFGRWDTPQHTVVDDKLTGFELSDMPKDADHCQLWPGKDYSNPRVQDFYALDKPYEEMYDRSKVPRMPWHDISMQIVGQPARDLTRHFVQRWNYVLRQRKPTRPTPFLLPPPDFNPADLESLGLDGTCEVQILRSCANWSMGTPNLVEHSIMNAYVKMIEQSDHFVYIENQFFIASCEVEGTRIENGIGDALVERIVRAFHKGEDWRAVVMIPLMPGFQNTVDNQDGTSIRLIMQCQFRSINRGEGSIFGRLRAQNIEPEDYIQFYSLRSWGKIGPAKQLVTEQLYIHAKCMIVDDRIAIIGSANINERSMRGDRDSECAAVVRDTDMLWSTMNGEPYLVGRFPHTLRMRLMREHLGIDVDELMDDERQEVADEEEEQWERDMERFHNGSAAPSKVEGNGEHDISSTVLKHQIQAELLAKSEIITSFNHDADWEQADNPNLKTNKKLTEDPRVTHNPKHEKDVEGDGPDHMKEFEAAGLARGRDTKISRGRREVLVSSVAPEGRAKSPSPNINDSPHSSHSRTQADSGNFAPPPLPKLPRLTSTQLGLPMVSQLPALPKTDDTDIGGPPIQRVYSQRTSRVISPTITETRRPMVDKDCMRDPLNDSFYLDTWHAVAENNTKLFRVVFRCMPDSEVRSWAQYTEWTAYAERFAQAQGGGKSKDRVQHETPGISGPPGQIPTSEKLRMLGPIGEKAGEVEEATGNILDKITHSISRKNENSSETFGEVANWAAEANRSQAERQEKEANEMQSGDGAVLDEKSAVRSPVEAPKDPQNLEKISKNQSPPSVPSVGYSDTVKTNSTNPNSTNQKRRRRATTRSSKKEFHASDDLIDFAEAEELLNMVQGHLVLWPYD
ncbi:MAG: hypothetical protein Q9187_001377, partial [Circinaria calcarea]